MRVVACFLPAQLTGHCLIDCSMRGETASRDSYALGVRSGVRTRPGSCSLAGCGTGHQQKERECSCSCCHTSLERQSSSSSMWWSCRAFLSSWLHAWTWDHCPSTALLSRFLHLDIGRTLRTMPPRQPSSRSPGSPHCPPTLSFSK